MSNRQLHPKTHKRPREAFKHVILSRDNQAIIRRVQCSGGCGTLVLASIGECRDCRRRRLRKGGRIIARLRRVTL